MSYVELKGTNKDTAQALLKFVLDHEDTVTMIVLGLDNEEIAQNAKEVIGQNPNIWWVVWVQNSGLLTDNQLKSFQGDNTENVVCVLSKSDSPVAYYSAEEASYKNVLLTGFLIGEGN